MNLQFTYQEIAEYVHRKFGREVQRRGAGAERDGMADAELFGDLRFDLVEICADGAHPVRLVCLAHIVELGAVHRRG